jgi:hypothetical protein
MADFDVIIEVAIERSQRESSQDVEQCLRTNKNTQLYKVKKF